MADEFFNDTFNILHIISSMFTGYTVYLFMEMFFIAKKSNFIQMSLSFCGYVLINNVVYFCVSRPIIQLIINILLLMCLTLNFESKYPKRLIAVAYVYLSMMLIETIIFRITGYIYPSIFAVSSAYYNIAGMITMDLVSFLLVLLFRNYKFIRNDIFIPTNQWLCVFLVPFGTLCIMLIILQCPNHSAVFILLSALIVLVTNVLVFGMYNMILKNYEEKINELRLKQQNIMYGQQLKLMQSAMINMSAVNHDIKNHLSIISGFLEQGNLGKVEKYLTEINSAYKVTGEYAKTGNFILDSILNYKIDEAVKANIIVELNAKVPKDLKLPEFDMNIILSNIIDNAIEACLKLLEDREIHIVINYFNGVLRIKIVNTFDGLVKQKNGRIITRNRDKSNHGIGLRNIRDTVEKYNGVIDIDFDTKKFIVNVMLYIG